MTYLYQFVHIPRTGGTFIGDCFSRKYGQERCIAMSSEADQNYWLGSIDVKTSIRFLTGHLKVGIYKAYPVNRPVLRFSIVRDPVARFVSLWAYSRANKDHELFLLASGELKTFFDNLKRFRPDYLMNEQCLYLSSSGTEDARTVLEEMHHDFKYIYPLDSLSILLSKLDVPISNQARTNASGGCTYEIEQDIKRSILSVFAEDQKLYLSLLEKPLCD
jgi:hypothetical protein